MIRFLTIFFVASVATAQDLPSWAQPLDTLRDLPAAYGELAWSTTALPSTWFETPPSAADIQWLADLAGGGAIAWVQTPEGARVIGWTTVPREWNAHEEWQDLLAEAGVDIMPSGLHRMSPLGLKWSRIYRGDTSWMDDDTYRQDLIDLITEIRQAQERRERLKERRGR